MSLAHERAVALLDLPTVRKFVLWVFAFHASSRTGHAWPKIETAALEASISTSTARRIIQWLGRHTDHGKPCHPDKALLIPVAYLHGGRGRSTEYLVNVEVVELSTELSTPVDEKPYQHIGRVSAKPSQTASKTLSRSSRRNGPQSSAASSDNLENAKIGESHQLSTPNCQLPPRVRARKETSPPARPAPRPDPTPLTHAENAARAAELIRGLGEAKRMPSSRDAKPDPSQHAE